ncbi:response regulator transcription factor [Alkaliphilus transvaalensis]|uniref:response regulator transcription factor n=1 Tax=Alkaliphilus transvaalensis TaxID=114628 RepID=UPI000479C0AF|nr:response regulator transcription factor [Alkaliphilus transvaalensis]
MESIKNVLVIDDEESIVAVIKAYLEREGFRVYVAYNGKEAIQSFYKNKIDFMILDLMLPDLSGEEICKEIRQTSNVPILMLTAKVAEAQRINGLDIGADDYLTKPFSPKELMARVRAIFRRTSSDNNQELIVIKGGDLLISPNKMEVKKDDKLVDLTATEFKILLLLAQNIGRVYSREELITKILGHDYEGYDRTIDTHIKNIRQKVEDTNHKYIITVYGAGYKFTEE